MKFYCIADANTVRGFRLAGVEGEAVQSATEAGEALHRAASQPGLGILIFTQGVAAGIRDQLDSFRFDHNCPLIVEIPGPEGPVAERGHLGQLVHSAVGIRLQEEKGTG